MANWPCPSHSCRTRYARDAQVGALAPAVPLRRGDGPPPGLDPAHGLPEVPRGLRPCLPHPVRSPHRPPPCAPRCRRTAPYEQWRKEGLFQTPTPPVYPAVLKTRAEARLKIATWITDWYNPHRRHSACDWLSPIDYENRHTIREPQPQPACCPPCLVDRRVQLTVQRDAGQLIRCVAWRTRCRSRVRWGCRAAGPGGFGPARHT